jgi:N-acetyl-gamma-glutamyl-phosphate reductase
MKFRIGVVGVTGYSGLELLKIALDHPGMDCAAAAASESTGEKPLAQIHPQFRGRTSLVCIPQNIERLAEAGIDTVFLCTPNEVSHALAPDLLAKGMRVVDLSGSFRLRDAASYPSWYGFDHTAPELLREAVYGLPEWNATAIESARLLANPGCYPTSVLLALLPLIRGGLLESGSEILCDSKSGVTGAGRAAKLNLMFGEVSENFRPYSPITHKHAPEICQELGWDIHNFTFVPHLLPVNRGILSTLYVSFQRPVSSEEIEVEFRRRYGKHRFIRVLGTGSLPEIRAVNHTNYCDIGWRLTSGGRRAVIFSAIDNLVKGAAGQAVQNFNLMHGFDEAFGLLGGAGGADHS